MITHLIRIFVARDQNLVETKPWSNCNETISLRYQSYILRYQSYILRYQSYILRYQSCSKSASLLPKVKEAEKK